MMEGRTEVGGRDREREGERERETVLIFSTRMTVFIFRQSSYSNSGIPHFTLMFTLEPEGPSKQTLVALEESSTNLG